MQSQFSLCYVGFSSSHTNQEENLFTFTVFSVFTVLVLVWLYSEGMINSAFNGLILQIFVIWRFRKIHTYNAQPVSISQIKPNLTQFSSDKFFGMRTMVRGHVNSSSLMMIIMGNITQHNQQRDAHPMTLELRRTNISNSNLQHGNRSCVIPTH